MKKMLTALSAVLLMASTLVFMGCDSDSEDGVPGKGVWLEKQISKKDASNNTSVLDVFLYYSDSGYTASDLRTGSNAVEIPAGLTLLITASSDSDSAASGIYKTLAGNKFVIKTYETGASFDDDSDDSSDLGALKGLTVNNTSWRILYAAMVASGSGVTKVSGTPELIKAGKSYEQLSYDKIKEDLTWKKLLVMLLES